MVRNKRGWIRILEATIAVMIVSGVLIVVYSEQADKGTDISEIFYGLQRQILADVSSRVDLRLAVLNTYNDSNSNDGNFSLINDFVKDRMPGAYNYSLRVCVLNDPLDHCKMSAASYIATLDRDVFAEEIVISSELGNGENRVYGAKKLKFFIWENRQ